MPVGISHWEMRKEINVGFLDKEEVKVYSGRGVN